VQPPSQSAAISAELRDEILRGQYRSGERLPSERDLAERFGVHRSAVREALKRLEQLGLAHIRPGGARVAPLDEASLDVVEHLLGLEDPPNPVVVDQVLEVMSGLFATAARLAAERATDEQRARIGELLGQLATDAQGVEDRVRLIHALGDAMVEASGNPVLRLVRRGLKTKFMERLEQNEIEGTAVSSLRPAHYRKLARAIEAHDGSAASEALYELTVAIRRHAVETITALRDRRSAVAGGA
jgi:DNA-binding FadR family transcriptional regulator